MGLRRVSVVAKRAYAAIDELRKNFEVVEDGEICIAIGGDGTFLEAARRYESPILLIRGGEADSLGFHADTTLEELPKVIERLKLGAYTVEKQPKLRITFKEKVFEATNDVALLRATPRSIHCRVSYYDDNGKISPLYPGDIRGDGVVISRQIGSTAYNYYSHGPILFGVDAAVVTPVSANYRFSIVCDRCFHVELTKSVGYLEYDGVEAVRLEKNEFFTVARSDKTVKIVRLDTFETFADKLGRLLAF
ncbi:MAG: hypothetical protein QXI32_03480 [Candidatus Bathyarchaeia archaeon]